MHHAFLTLTSSIFGLPSNSFDGESPEPPLHRRMSSRVKGAHGRRGRSCGESHRTHLGLCRCACVLVDVGLNDGSTLESWALEAARSGGRPVGGGLNDPAVRALLAQSGGDYLRGDGAWPSRRAQLEACTASADDPDPERRTCYYGFEANGVFDQPLGAIEAGLRAKGRHVKLFTSTAFNVHANPATFLVEPKSSRTGNTGATLEKSKTFWFVDQVRV